MKHFILSALCWALTMGYANAQKQLAPHATTSKAEWPTALEKLMKDAGYVWSDEPENKRGPFNPDNTNGEMRLDSTILFYNYDATTTQDSTPLFRTVYTYPEEGTELSVESEYVNGQWFSLNRSTLVHDDLRRILTAYAEAFDFDTQSWEPDSKIENYPHGDDAELVDSLLVYGWSDETQSWILLLKNWNIFDDAGRLAQSYSLFDAFGEPLVYKDIYYYDSNGDNHLIESFLLLEGVEYLGGKEEILYENHQIISSTSYTSDGFGTFFPAELLEYTYTNEGLLETTAYYEWTVDWVMIQTAAYEYDGEGRLKNLETQLFNLNPNGPDERDLTSYIYQEGEYISYTSYYVYDFDQEAFNLQDRTHYYYSEENTSAISDNPKQLFTIHPVPNPTVDFTEIQLEEKALVSLFDAQGRLLLSQHMSAGKTALNLQQLPSGIYQLNVHTDTAIYQGRIVKR